MNASLPFQQFTIKDAPNATLYRMMTDTFEKLPPEILLPIVESLPDLLSLYSFTKASPAIDRLFTCHGSKIMDVVVTENLSRRARVIISNIVLVRSSRLRCDTLDDFTQNYLSGESIEQQDHIFPFPSDESQSTLARGVLELAYKIEAFSAYCLQNMIDRCAALRPFVLDFWGVFLLRNGLKTPELLRRYQPSGEIYVPQITNQISPVEKERGTIAFWLVQLFYELKNAAANSRLSWVQRDVELLNRMGLEEFHRLSLWKHYFEAIMTVADYTQDFKSDDDPTRKHCDNRESGNYRLPPLPETAKPDWSAMSLSYACVEEHHKRTLKTYSAVQLFFEAFPFMSFRPFRCYGFAFWNTERLEELELMPYRSRIWGDEDDPTRIRAFVAWKSIREDAVKSETSIFKRITHPLEYRTPDNVSSTHVRLSW